jgi:hypothetical protein
MHNHQERARVTTALAAVAALGVLSAAVPAVAIALLVALAVAVLAGIGWAIHFWHATRIPNHQPQQQQSHTAARTPERVS